ncbi:MAG: LPS assembly lipoprotein LptE [Legionella sp.]|nr:LPS assembly lipoprotein LptE [Legionella sp.]
MNHLKNIILLFLITTLITNCGFQLRGHETSPDWLKKGVAIVVEEKAHNWKPLLHDPLEASHIRVIDDPKKAPYWLIIKREALQRDLVSVSSSTTPRQYQLTYTVWFSLQTAKGHVILEPTSVFVTRPLTINNERVLGSRNEGEKLKAEMKRDAAFKIIEFLYQQESSPPHLKGVKS